MPAAAAPADSASGNDSPEHSITLTGAPNCAAICIAVSKRSMPAMRTGLKPSDVIPSTTTDERAFAPPSKYTCPVCASTRLISSRTRTSSSALPVMRSGPPTCTAKGVPASASAKSSARAITTAWAEPAFGYDACEIATEVSMRSAPPIRVALSAAAGPAGRARSPAAPATATTISLRFAALRRLLR